MLKEISPKEFQALAADDTRVTLLDVREEWELALASVGDALHIPMGQVPDRLAELERDALIVVMCHHGSRSATVAAFLQQSGYAQVLNLAGGIDAWARELDPDVPTY